MCYVYHLRGIYLERCLKTGCIVFLNVRAYGTDVPVTSTYMAYVLLLLCYQCDVILGTRPRSQATRIQVVNPTWVTDSIRDGALALENKPDGWAGPNSQLVTFIPQRYLI